MTATVEVEDSTPVEYNPDEVAEARALARPTSAPQTTITTITPAMAAFFIEKNPKNRSIRPNVVNAYTRVMEAKGWKLTGEGLKFDVNGDMIDGQHRCLAIIKSGLGIEMTVTRGLQPETQAVMDSGVKRNAQDHFLMNGVKNSALLSAIARYSLKLIGAKSPTNAELIQWVEDHDNAHAAAEVASTYRTTIDIHPSVLGVAWMRLSELDLEHAEEFYDSISSHRTDGHGDPRNALIRRMTSARRANERLSQDAQLSLVYRAWNSWSSSEKLYRLPIDSRSGRIRIPDPVPYGSDPRDVRRTVQGRDSAGINPNDFTEEDYADFDWPTPEGGQPQPEEEKK